MAIPQADIFWDHNKWYWVDYTSRFCYPENGHERLHDAIVDAIKNGYEIRDFRKSRGNVKVGKKYG